MNRKCILGAVMIFVIITSGPIYYPLAVAASNYIIQDPTVENNDFLNQTDVETKEPDIDFQVVSNFSYVNAYNQSQNEVKESSKINILNRPFVIKPSTKLIVSDSTGLAPLQVTFEATHVELKGWTPLIYNWDFDGDGVNEYSSYTNKATKVYAAKEEATFHPIVTIRYTNGYSTTASSNIRVTPRTWVHEYRNYHTYINVDELGNTYVYDQNNLISIIITRDNELLSKPKKITDSKLQTTFYYETEDTEIKFNIKYGLTGRAYFNLTETLKQSTKKNFENITKLLVSNPVQIGRLSLTESTTTHTDKTQRAISFDAGNADPWKDQGLTPYGDYFSNIDEYISMQTGYLTVVQTDFNVPGRGLDLVIKRVLAPPSDFEYNEPADSSSYTYQGYPWAPMGNGWELGFPWLELDDDEIAYIHLGNGQRYEYKGDGIGGTEYHEGDNFELFRNQDYTYSLYTSNGIRYDFDSNYAPTGIIDVHTNNSITFNYTNNKITTITDTIGRNVTLSYGGYGQVSSIIYGNKTYTYSYAPGIETGYQLISHTDPLGRKTNYTYCKDYLLTQIQYPSGGYTLYDYNCYSYSRYYRYRVRNQILYDGTGNKVIRRYVYDGDFSSVDETKIIEYYNEVAKKVTIMDYPSETSKIETIYNGTELDTKIYSEYSTLYENKRRKEVGYFPGDSTQSFNSTLKYDVWGNLIYSRNDYGYEEFYSYINTETSDAFYYSNGTQTTLFRDNFYDNSVHYSIHDRLTGKATLNNGTNSYPIETYYAYSYEGDLKESKSFLKNDWITELYVYDDYGNLISYVNSNNNTIFSLYDENDIYLVETRQPLNLLNNITTSYIYDQTTGELVAFTDPESNTYTYSYDQLGRVTRVTNPSINNISTFKEAVYNDTVIFSVIDPICDTAKEGVSNWYRPHSFTSEGRTWVFSYVDDFIQFTSSDDNDNWDSLVEVPQTEEEEHWNLFFDGEYVHLVFTQARAEYNLYYKRGNPNPDGTITWDSRRKAYDVGNYRARNPSIAVTDNYVWIFFEIRVNADNKDPYVTCSSNMNGGWTTRFTSKMFDYDKNPYGKIVPLTDDKVYFAWCYDKSDQSSTGYIKGYLWNGNSWSQLEYINTGKEYDVFDITSWGNDVYLFHTDGEGNYVRIQKRDYVTGEWSIINSPFIMSDAQSVQIVRGAVYGTLYAFWQDTGDIEGINMQFYNGAEWSPTEVLYYDAYADDGLYTLSIADQPFNGQIAITYTTGTSPNTIRSLIYEVDYRASTSSVKIFDENGNFIKNYYNGLGLLTKFERYNDSVLYSSENYTYNWQHLNEMKILPNGYNYTFYYDTVGNVIKTNNPDESITRIEYDYSSNTRTYFDEEGRKKVLHYDLLNRLIKVDEYNSSNTQYSTVYRYDAKGNLCKIVDASERTTEYIYDELKRLEKKILPNGRVEVYVYDDTGNLIQHMYPNNTWVVNTYDNAGRLVNASYYPNKITYQSNWINGWSHRKNITIIGRDSEILENYPIRLTLYYDNKKDKGSKLYLGNYSRLDFTDIRFTDTLGSELDYWIESFYPGVNATVWVEVNTIPAASNKVDILCYYGNQNASSQSNGKATFDFFDDFNDGYINTTMWQQRVQTYGEAYESDGFLVLNSSASSGSKTFLISYNTFSRSIGDYWGRTSVKYVDPLGGCDITTLAIMQDPYNFEGGYIIKWDPRSTDDFILEERDKEGDLDGSDTWQVTLAANRSYIIDLKADATYSRGYFDDVKRLEESTESLRNDVKIAVGTNSDSGYSSIVAKYDWIFFEYLPALEPSVYAWVYEATNYTNMPDTSRLISSVSYTYDDAGNLLSSCSGDNLIDYEYDALGRVKVENVTIFDIVPTYYSTEYTYDAIGNVVGLIYPDGSEISLGYDFGNRLTSVDDYASVSYTLLDGIDTITYGNGVATGYSYDSRNRPTNIETVFGGSPLLDLTYTYDLTGSVTSINNGTYTEYYTYDLLDRLNSTVGPWGIIDYTYDPVGNRLSKSVQGGSTITYTYDDMNRISSATGLGFDWDGNGNMVYKHDGVDAWNYTYDPLNRLTQVQKDGGLSALYSYDAGGRRVRSWDTVDGSTDYVYSGLNIIDEISGGVHEKHIYAGGMHIASNTTGTVEYYHVDHLGSTRLKTNNTGGIIYETNYEPFGPSSGEAGDEDYKYTGKPEDTTGLYYFGARYYDPDVGRFITRDTVFGDLSNPQSLNRYVYCRNNPQKYTDPDGNFVTELLVLGTVGGGVIGAANKMNDFHRNYQKHKLGSYTKGMIAAGVSGFAKGAISGLGTGVKAVGAVYSIVNPLSAVGGVVFKSVADVAAEYVEVGVEQACITLMEDDSVSDDYRSNTRSRLTEATADSGLDVVTEVTDCLLEYSWDPSLPVSIGSQNSADGFNSVWINSHVDSSRDWLEQRRF